MSYASASRVPRTSMPSRFARDSSSRTARATDAATSLCTSKTSSKPRSYVSDQMCAPEAASTRWTTILIRVPLLRTLPSTTVPTPRSVAIRVTSRPTSP